MTTVAERERELARLCVDPLRAEVMQNINTAQLLDNRSDSAYEALRSASIARMDRLEARVADALATCANEALERDRQIKIGNVTRIVAELRSTGKDFDSMGYGLFGCKMRRLASEVEDLAERALKAEGLK